MAALTIKQIVPLTSPLLHSSPRCRVWHVIFPTAYDHAKACAERVTSAAGRMGSVQPSERAGDGFSTPVVHNTQQSKPLRKSALEEMRANALAAHATSAHKVAEASGAHLTDNLLNL